jgi:hypothetical protein
MHQVAGHKRFGRKFLPFPVAQHPRFNVQRFAQERQRVLCAPLLQESHSGVESQKGEDHGRFKVPPKRQLQHDHRFQHPGHWCPKLDNELSPSWGRFVGDGIGAVLRQASLYLAARKPPLMVCGRQIRWGGFQV